MGHALCLEKFEEKEFLSIKTMFSFQKTTAEEAEEENAEEWAAILKELDMKEVRNAEEGLRKEEEARIEQKARKAEEMRRKQDEARRSFEERPRKL